MRAPPILLCSLLASCTGLVEALDSPDAAFIVADAGTSGGGGVAGGGVANAGGGVSSVGGGASGGGGGGSASGGGGSASGGGGSATGGGATTAAGGGSTSFDAGNYFIPNPLISVGAPILASSSTKASAALAFDGRIDTGDWQGPTPAADGSIADMWVRVQLGTGSPCEGPSSVLLVWHSNGDPDYTIEAGVNYGTPTGYRLETSADGASWTTAVTINATTTYRARSHRLDFAGKCYLRMTVTALATTIPGRTPGLAEIAIYDASHGTDDSWIFLGNGPTRFAYDGHFQAGFAADVSAKHPKYSPAVIDAAELPGNLDTLLGSLDAGLALNPSMRHWVVAAGLEEVSYGETPAQSQFKVKAQQLIDRLRSAGVDPLLMKVRYATSAQYAQAPAYDAIIDELIASNGLLPTPDLYSLFKNQPSLLCSSSSNCETNWIGISPADPAGYEAENQAWADTLDSHYAP